MHYHVDADSYQAAFFMPFRSIAFFVLFVASLPVIADSPAWQPDSTTIWPASGGQARLELRGDFLPDHGVEVLQGTGQRHERFTAPVPVMGGALWIYAPFGNFEDFSGGELMLATDLTLRHRGRELVLDRLLLRPAEQERIPVLQMFDADGNHLANVTHIHALLHHDAALATLHNADVTATARLAEMLGQPALTDLPIGQLWLDLTLDIPSGADLSGQGIDFSGRGLSCDTRPWWPQDGYVADVELIAMGQVAGGGFEPNSGHLKITPSATLKNAGDADVPWFRQFDPAPPSLYPHDPRDQHPFLLWNLYRIKDGRIEQLAASGTKHAFFTINVNCDLNCFNGNILWPGCEDTYAVNNNDSSTYQGPRSEIDASKGLWDSCNSFFDSDCNGSQDGFSGQWNNRLLVDPAELDHADADYFMGAWYVIQYDVDIFNTMGYRSINPNQGGSGGYTFNPLGTFTNGSPLSEWVAEGGADPLAGHELIVVPSLTPDEPYPFNMPQGHLRVLARAEDLGDGTWRYRYAVMNFDFDRGVDAFTVPLADDAEVLDTWMGGPPDVLSGAWSATVFDDRVVFSSPGGRGGFLPWYTLYNFELVTDQAPVEGGLVRLGAVGKVEPDVIDVDMPAPGNALLIDPMIFEDRFEGVE
ncbi:MAG: hypothetical protein V2J10_10050 [Wenzhouxiangella sp.]|jgi:hypothetical protein|nr:hypothetical protein [Wenzhouxiangella sp.]